MSMYVNACQYMSICSCFMFWRSWSGRHRFKCVLTFVLVVSENEWNYGALKGSSAWESLFPSCSGSSRTQSPVAINSNKIWHSSALTAFDLHGYDTIPARTHWTLKNDGKNCKYFLVLCTQTGLCEHNEKDVSWSTMLIARSTSSCVEAILKYRRCIITTETRNWTHAVCYKHSLPWRSPLFHASGKLLHLVMKELK